MLGLLKEVFEDLAVMKVDSHFFPSHESYLLSLSYQTLD